MNKVNLQIKRNEKCPCGSNKKFKICCQQNIEMISEYTFNKKVKGELNKREFDKENNIKWRTSISKLPTEIQKSIKMYISNSSVVEYGCYYNSSHLSIFDKRIKTIHGWYGKRISEDMILEVEKVFKNKDSLTRIIDDFGEQIIDFKNKILYSPHTWNEFNGIYFDISTEGNDTFDKWVYYNKVESIDFSQVIKNEIVEKYYLEKLNYIKSTSPYRILNEKIIKLLPKEIKENEKLHS